MGRGAGLAISSSVMATGTFATHILAYTSLGEEFEQFELAQRAQAEHGVLKRRDLLDRNLAPAGSVQRTADDAVCALTNNVEDLVLGTCFVRVRVSAFCFAVGFGRWI
jgi:hypothetical protein